MRDRFRLVAGAVVCVLVAGVGAIAGAPPQARAANTAPQIDVLLPGGVGDGGPAADALVNASHLFRAANGDLIVTDVSGVRRISNGLIAADTGLPPLTAAARGDGSPTGTWQTESGTYYRIESDSQVWVVRVTETGSAEVVRGARIGEDSVRVLEVSRQGAIVLVRDSSVYLAPTATELLNADGSVRPLGDYAARTAATAEDGTVFLSTGQDVVRIRPDGATDVVGGTACQSSSPAENWPATQVCMYPRRLAVTPAGDRVVYVQAEFFNENVQYVRTFAVGGVVTGIAGGSGEAATPCGRPVAALLAEADRALLACGGVRSYTYDGLQRSTAGTVLAGRNLAPGTTDSASGTPLARAYLGVIREIERAPDGRPQFVTGGGVYALEGTGADATLVRVLDSGLDPGAFVDGNDSRTFRTENSVDAAYGPDGTLYLLASGPLAGSGRLLARSPEGLVTTLSQGGTATATSGAALALVRLDGGRIVVRGNGIHLGLAEKVWRVDPQTNTLEHVAGTPEGTERVDVPAVSASSGRVGWLGTHPRTGNLLITDPGGLREVDANGVMRTATGFGPGYASGADGSVYSASSRPGTVWRHRPDGARVVALGAQPFGPGFVGVALEHPTIADGPDGRLVVVDVRRPSAWIALVRPGEPTFSGPAPALQVTATFGFAARVEIRTVVPADRGRWYVVAQVAHSRERLERDLGYVPYSAGLGPGQEYAASIEHYLDRRAEESSRLQPGARVWASLRAYPADASTAPPPVYREVVVPGRPSYFSKAFSTGTVAIGAAASIGGGILLGTATRAPLPGRTVELQSRVKGTSTWKKVATVVSGSDGSVRATHRPTRTCFYRFVYRGDGQWAQSVSPVTESSVRPKLTLKAPTSAKVGTTITASGVVSPGVTGRTVSLQRYVDGKWKTVGTAKIGSGGRVSIKTRLSSVATYTFRLSLPAATDLAAGTSAGVKVKVVRS
ncbi:MAG: hypothetical protein ACT4QF_18645 [Sporichthyaceae bacterium]